MAQQTFPYKLRKLAEKWNLPEDEILHLAAAGEITLSIWWSGHWYKDKSNTPSPPLDEFVNIEKEKIQELIHGCYIEENGGVEVDFVYRQNGEKILLFIPSQEENVVFPPIIKTSSLRVLPEEVERFSHNNSDKLNKISTPPTIKELLPSERKSLIKMIFVMAMDGYGYDPDAKKSPIPNEISKSAAKANISITDDTIRKWLQEGAKLQKDDF